MRDSRGSQIQRLYNPCLLYHHSLFENVKFFDLFLRYFTVIYKRVSIGHSINYSLVDFKSRYDPEHKDTVNSLRSRFSNGYPGDPETLCACASVGNLVVGRAFRAQISIAIF